MRWILLAVVVLIVLPAAGFGLWSWGALHYSYSDGERTGYVQKISHKGWVCKTWEGELTMVTQAGVPPQLFQFSVRDEGVAQKIVKAGGQRVTLSYAQHKGLPGSCFGETEYFITGVQPAPSN